MKEIIMKEKMEATLSYGIGVRNRYSAFLEEDDAFNLSNRASVTKQQHPSTITLSKQKNTNTNHLVKASTTSTRQNKNHQNVKAARLNNSTSVYKTEVTHPQKIAENGQAISNNVDQQKRPLAEGRRQRSYQQQHHAGNNNSSVTSRQESVKYRQASIKNQDHSVNALRHGSRSLRTYPPIGNHNDQTFHSFKSTPINQQHQPINLGNKENNSNAVEQQHGRTRNFDNQRTTASHRRPFLNGEKKNTINAELVESPSALCLTTGEGCIQSIEEEKHRRQQKRDLDLKHKDPEKREARKQQAQKLEQTDNIQSGKAQLDEEALINPKGIRRQSESNGDGAPTRTFRGFGGGGRGRGRRTDQSGVEGTEDNDLIGGQKNRSTRSGEKLQRVKNGSTRAGRGFKGEEQYKAGRSWKSSDKPIPNFSDKLDFPSLMS